MSEHNERRAVPPKIAEKLLHWCLPAKIRDQLIGDLFEQFEQLHSNSDGKLLAQIWFWRQSVDTALFYLYKEKGGFMAFIVSIIILIVMTLGAMLLGGALGFYWDIPSLLIVVPPAIAFGIAASSVDAYKNSIRLAFVDQLEVDRQTAKSACHFLTVTGTSGMYLAVVMTLIGWVSMGANIKAAEFSTVIGQAFAVSILTIIYAIMLKLVCYTAAQKIQFKYLPD